MLEFKNTIFIGTHIPKTAGSSLISHFKNELGFKNLHVTTSLIENANLDIKFLEESFHNNLVRVVFGHHVDENTLINFKNKNIYLYTFIRDPINRIISHFLFDKKLRMHQNRGVITFEQFYLCEPKNSICNWLINKFPTAILDSNASLCEQSISILSIFNFIGSTIDFDVKVKFLLQDIGIKTSIPTQENVSNFNLEKDHLLEKYGTQLEQENYEDLKLYKLYLKNADNLNPFGFNSTRQKEFISAIMGKRETLKTLANNYSKAINEYCNYNIEQREINRAIKNLEYALLKCKVFIEELNDKKSEEKVLSLLASFNINK